MLNGILKLARPIVATILGTIVAMSVQTGFVWLPPGFGLLYEGAVATVIGILWWRWQARSIRQSPRRVSASASTVAMSVLCAGSIGLAQGYWAPATHHDVVDAASRSLWSVAALLIAVGIVGPLLEETLFRRYLLAALQRQYGARMAVLLSAVVFAAVHEDSGQWAAQFVAGVVLACIVVITGRLWLAVASHSAMNLTGPLWIPLQTLGASAGIRVVLTAAAIVVASLAAIGLRRVLSNTPWDTMPLDPASEQRTIGTLTLSASR